MSSARPSSSSSASPSPRPRPDAGFFPPHAAAPSPRLSPSPSPSSPSPLGDVASDDPDDGIGSGGAAAGARPDSPDLPLTMTASTVLLNLPRDATAALATAGRFPRDKVVVRFKPIGAAPALSVGATGGDAAVAGAGAGAADVKRKITATHKFEVVVAFVRRALRVQETESVFLYVNSAFAPALDEVVGNLHQCFKDSHDQLNVSYSLTPAFG